MKSLLTTIVVAALSFAPSLFAANVEHCRQLVAAEWDAFTPEEASAFHRDAYAAYRDCLGFDLPLEVRVNALKKYAVSEDIRGNAQAAVDAFQQAIALLDKDPTDHEALLIELLDMAVLADENANLASVALEHSSRALSLRETVFGEQSAEAAIGRLNLGIVYAQFGDYEKSEPLLREAVRIAEKVCAPECDALARAYSGMSALYMAKGEKEEAKKYDEMILNATPTTKLTRPKD